MPKIAIIFKPYRSGFTQIMQKDWFWEYPEKDFFYTKELRWKKYIISWVQQIQIFDIYKYLCENYDNTYKFIISVNIWQLFDDAELKELEDNNFI